jgi:iron complex transport system substrate-binding protein
VRTIAGIGALLALSFGATAAVGPPAAPREPAPPGPGEVRDRIVSAMLSSDEILLSLLPPERMLAVGRFAVDPTVSHVSGAARRVPLRVGIEEPEVLVALQPEVVFADAFVRPEVRALLARSQVPVVRLPVVTDFDGVGRNVRTVGALVGESVRAEALVAGMHETLDDVRSRVRGAARPRVLLVNRGYTAGPGTLWDEMLGIAGATNAAAEMGIHGHAPVTLERALEVDPDVIIVNEWRADGLARSVVQPPALADDPLWSATTAARTGRVHEMQSRSLMSTSHFAAEGVDELARVLHPDGRPR